jgi:hypothetical protein
MTDFLKTSLSRRAVLQTAAVGAVGINPALRAAVYAAGLRRPREEGSQDRLHPADRLRQRGHGLGAGH